FDGDARLERGVLRQPDVAHSAGAEQAHELDVLRDASSRRERLLGGNIDKVSRAHGEGIWIEGTFGGVHGGALVLRCRRASRMPWRCDTASVPALPTR